MQIVLVVRNTFSVQDHSAFDSLISFMFDGVDFIIKIAVEFLCVYCK